MLFETKFSIIFFFVPILLFDVNAYDQVFIYTKKPQIPFLNTFCLLCMEQYNFEGKECFLGNIWSNRNEDIWKLENTLNFQRIFKTPWLYLDAKP